MTVVARMNDKAFTKSQGRFREAAFTMKVHVHIVDEDEDGLFARKNAVVNSNTGSLPERRLLYSS